MSKVLSVEEYLSLSKKERVALYHAREEEERNLLLEQINEDDKLEPDHLKKHHQDQAEYMKKKIILPCWWTADEEVQAIATAMNVSPYRCPHFDSSMFQCKNFEDGWIDCEEVALRIKLRKQKNTNC